MELIVEKLKLLDYEKDFLAAKKPKWEPLTRTYFALPCLSNNQSEQFYYFTSLVAYLLKLAGRKFQTPDQWDDPNVVCSNIFAELKACQFATPTFAPGKLKQAYGREVVGVLDGLCDLVIERNFTQWARPHYLPDNYPEEPDIDDDALDGGGMGVGGGGGLHGGDDIADDAVEDDDDEEEEPYMIAGGGGLPGAAAKTAEELEDAKAIESQVDAAEWKLELERVAPQLRVVSAADQKDWRSHLEAAHKHQDEITRTFPEVKVLLDHVANDVSQMLEKVETREKYVNNQLEPLSAEYQHHREKLNGVQERYNNATGAVSDLTNELARVSEELEKVKQVMATKGDNIADTKPLNDLKGSIDKLNKEVKLMEVRIGVVRNTLLKVTLKKKDAKDENKKPSNNSDDYSDGEF